MKGAAEPEPPALPAGSGPTRAGTMLLEPKVPSMRRQPLRRVVTWVIPLALAPGGPAQTPSEPAVPPPVAPAQARLVQTLGALDGPGFAIAYDEGAGILAAACERGTIRYWNKDVLLGVRSGEGTPNVLKGHAGPVTALGFRRPWLASAGADQKILVWSLDGRILQTLTTGGPVRALALSPDGKLVAGAGDDPAIQLWGTAVGKPEAKLTAHTDWVLALDFSPDGKTLASGGYDGTVRIWDVTQRKKLHEFAARPAPAPAAPPNGVTALAFNPDGKFLAVGGTDTQVHLFNPADGKLIRSLAGHTSTVTGLAFHPSGSVVASASKDGTVRLWNPVNGQALKTLTGHTAWVQGVTFVAQGTRLASVGADQTVRLWDLTPPK